jgi:hypothetical protein
VTQPANGSVVVNADGSVTYTPDGDFSGTDTFTYTVCDPDGLCDTGTVTVTVNPVNDPPVAVNDTPVTNEDTPVSFNVLTNDSDPEGDVLRIDSWTDPANGTITVDPVTGAVTYTPDAGFSGNDSFTYIVCDDGTPSECVQALVEIDVLPVNDVPVAAPDAAATDEDTPVTIPVLANDSDPDGDPLTVAIVTPPANGSVTVHGDGTITYTPNPNFNGTDTFEYEACDPSGACSTAPVIVTVAPVADAPVAVDDSAVTDEDSPVTFVVLGNDSDPDGDVLSVDSVTQPANGSVVVNADGSVTYICVIPAR